MKTNLELHNPIVRTNFVRNIEFKAQPPKILQDVVGAIKIVFVILAMLIVGLFRKILLELHIFIRRQKVNRKMASRKHPKYAYPRI